MRDTDVVIAGAGPAGSATALRLARAGARVVVVERARFPRRKVCGEYLSVGAVRSLDALGVGDAVRAAASPVFGIRLCAHAADPVVLRFPGTALALERERLDALLLEAAQAAGAELLTARVEEVVWDDGRVRGVRVRARDGRLRDLPARYVVGADGIGSVVARRLGLARTTRGTRRFAVGGHYAGCGELAGFIEMYVGDGSYLALNALRADRTNVMLVVPEAAFGRWASDVDRGMATDAVALSHGARDIRSARRLGERVAIGPLRFDVYAAVAPGAILVGDAAGTLDPFTGQGVHVALLTAQRAARTLLCALYEPAADRTLLRAYERDRRRDAMPRRLLSACIAGIARIPALARRVSVNVARFPAVGETLVGAVSGMLPPERALAPATLARMLR